MASPDFNNPERVPVATLLDLAMLRQMSDEEAREAYQDGAEGWPCGDNRDRAYWHSWRQGAADKRRRECDIYDRLLAIDVAKVGFLQLDQRISELRDLISQAQKLSAP